MTIERHDSWFWGRKSKITIIPPGTKILEGRAKVFDENTIFFPTSGSAVAGQQINREQHEEPTTWFDTLIGHKIAYEWVSSGTGKYILKINISTNGGEGGPSFAGMITHRMSVNRRTGGVTELPTSYIRDADMFENNDGEF